MAMARNEWLRQAGSGMFFDTAPDLTAGNSLSSYAFVDYSLPNGGPDGSFGTAGNLDVLGLNTQFPDNTQLWMKYTCPGNDFGSSNIEFKIERIIQNDNNKFVTSLVKEFSYLVDPNAGIVRFILPSFSTGPGTYIVTAYTNGQARFSRWMRYLGPGESPDPTFLGY
jgi:hypothetical protein